MADAPDCKGRRSRRLANEETSTDATISMPIASLLS